MRGILLAGGTGSRLFPLTAAVSKHLLPVYDKPVLYYPLSVLMLAGVRDILLISTPRDLPMIRALLGDGEQLGLALRYAEQPRPAGIAQALLLAEDFLQGEPACLVLGDNIFYGHELGALLGEAAALTAGAHVFAYHVHDPERYGVIEFDAQLRPMSLEEKPGRPRSPWAVTGLYFYDGEVVEVARNLKPSARGELEITDVNRHYLRAGRLRVTPLGRGVAWLDAGTPDSLLTASLFVQTLEQRQGLKLACLEEVAWHKGFIDAAQFARLAERCPAGAYADYLRRVLDERRLTPGGDARREP